MTLRTGKDMPLLIMAITPLTLFHMHLPSLHLHKGFMEGDTVSGPICQLQLTEAILQLLILLDHQLCITSPLPFPGPGTTGQGLFLS